MTTTSFHILSAGVAGIVTGILINEWVRNSNSKIPPPKRSAPKKLPLDLPIDLQSEWESDSESDSDIDYDGTNLNSVPGEVRMTLVVRQDLKMGKGKAAAQCSHATLALYKKMANPELKAYNPEMLMRWERGNGQAKITLQVPSQEDMDLLFATAMSLGVNAYIVHDAGRTQIAAGSATVLGLGPAPKAVMDEITSNLKLY